MIRSGKFLCGSLLLTATAFVQAGEWSGYVALEGRGFTQEAVFPDQDYRVNLSLSAQPEYFHKWDNGKQSFTFVPFVRYDQHDSRRTHADVRELTWLKAGKDYEWRLGVRKLFWGVTESQHLVDIINQTDLIENLDGEEKLGQPMANLALIRSWGTLDLFVLPGFRDRTFPGAKGRLRSAIPVATDRAQFESSQGRNHVDLAARWSRTLGDFDFGVAHFSGTSREPRLLLALDGGGNPVLIPYYDLIDQTSLDLQATKGSWLWKLEAISRAGQPGGRYTAMTGGFEYTVVGALETQTDVGLLAEYLFDDRGQAATTPFDDDVFVGMRLSFNDAQSSEALVGAIVDRTTYAKSVSLEASRRFGQQWKLSLEARFFSHIPEKDQTLFGVRSDDYIQLEMVRHF